MTIDQIDELTSQFNSRTNYARSDFLITKVFAQSVDARSHYERVVLLDALFNTNLTQSRPSPNQTRKTIFEISEGIRVSLAQLREIVAPFDVDTLFSLDLANQDVRDSISRALNTILSSLNNNSLSFTGKYLHFVYPKVFPLWDKLVPQAINDIYHEEIFPRNNLNTADYYLLLCQKYQQIASQFTEVQIIQMQQHDHDSQPEGWRIANTFVRILDKALWMHQKSRSERNGV